MLARQYTFQKVALFLQENKVLDAPPSNIDAFLSRDTCVSLSQLTRPIWNKMSDSSLLNPDRLEVFLSKTTSILTGIKGARFFCF
jgi:hypothetical protein